MKQYRVLHAPINIAGQASMISKGQRELGIKSDVLCHNSNVLNYPCDFVLNLNEKKLSVHLYKRMKIFFYCLKNYDIFHFHFGMTLLPKHMDLYLLKMLGKKTIMHYWGSDVIQFGKIGEFSRIDKKDVADRIAKCDDATKAKMTQWMRKHVDVTIVGDYSLLPYSPTSIVVRQAIDIQGFPFVGAEWKGGAVRIVHAPTCRALKGTDHIIKAVERLKSEGYQIDFILVENMSNQQAIEIYRSADIVVDDVVLGPYGILAIECMAMGKPVLDFIHEKFVGHYHDLPIVNTSPEMVYENLKQLINDPLRRESLGRQGRKYVEDNHDAVVVARSISEIYDRL